MNRPSYRRPSTLSRLLGGGRGFILAICALVLAVLLLLRLALPGAFAFITTPLWSVGAYISGKVPVADIFSSRSELIARRDDLETQNASLVAQNAALTARVADLTALLGTRAEPSKGILASVLARPPVAPYDVLIIDQGVAAGVVIGAQVRGAGGTPIGVIGQVEGNRSRVTLYSARSIKTDGWVGAGRIPLTLEGRGAGAFTATVSKDAGVVVGDGIYLSGNGAFPVGTVTNIEQDPSSPTVELDVRPYANPFSLTWVTVAPE